MAPVWFTRSKSSAIAADTGRFLRHKLGPPEYELAISWAGEARGDNPPDRGVILSSSWPSQLLNSQADLAVEDIGIFVMLLGSRALQRWTCAQY
jgi:hypothetical protein